MDVIASMNGKSLYAKGTMEVHLYDIATNDRRGYSNKVKSRSLEHSVNLGEISGGMGEALLIQIPDTSRVKMTLSKADFDLGTQAMLLGADLHYGGVVDLHEVVTASADGKIVVSQTPVAPLGGCDPVCTIGAGGKSYAIDPATKTVQEFAGESGKDYCVHYWVMNASAQQMDVFANFAPAVVRCFIKQPIYSVAEGQDPLKGTCVGYLLTTIPRLSLDPNGSIGGEQTGNDTQNISGVALSYEEACNAGTDAVCLDSSRPKAYYQVLVLDGDQYQNVTGLVVVGGGITVAAGATATLPVKLVVGETCLVQPDLSDLTYNVAATSTATVTNGIVKGVAAGSTEVTVKLASKNLECTANIDVT